MAESSTNRSARISIIIAAIILNIYLFIEITCGYRAGHLSLYSICLLLTEFEVRVVSYGLNFFLSDMYVSSAKREGYKSKRKKRGSETHSMDRVDEVSNCYLLRTVYL